MERMESSRPSRPQTVTDDELHTLLDAKLPPEQLQAIEAHLAQDPAAAATLQAWRLQRAQLGDLHLQILDEPVPPILMATAQRVESARHQADSWRRWGGMAASVLLSFGLGWGLHGQLRPYSLATAGRLALAPGGVGEFVRQAAVAHAVYTPEVRHPVEVGVAQQEHLIQWLSKRLDSPLKIPDLSSLGYELVGGRLLPGAVGARAQFMFQRADGTRITLYLGGVHPPGSGQGSGTVAPNSAETAFSYSGEGPVPSFYWVEKGLGYALAGKLPREQLMQIAQAVYRQL